MGAESLTENTPHAPKFICPICLPKPKSSGFQWKKLRLASLVRAYINRDVTIMFYVVFRIWAQLFLLQIQQKDKVHIFWEGRKILQNLHLTFDWHYIGQK